ncbi:hypothetical protein NDU88_001267 [Pleurodeles waltl]|uniref:Uncharacterized protein n=1 Tax=Pleurodeles waltl TaxID=8319 RepID=A0AAV7Q356_PLEWA|nr:hypothetical protein NDU88_001267 [Pleurodeles waltl]
MKGSGRGVSCCRAPLPELNIRLAERHAARHFSAGSRFDLQCLYGSDKKKDNQKKQVEEDQKVVRGARRGP